MNESKAEPNHWYFKVLLFALFILVFLFGFNALRLVRDDWSSISNFSRGLSSNNPFSFLIDIITNRWIGMNQSRIFFFSWLIQIAVGSVDRFNYVPYYLFILTWHFISSVLLFSVLNKHLKAPAISTILSCIYLVAPANTNVLFWLNNWFFSIPVFLLILQLYMLTFPIKNLFLHITILSLVTICGQFSGEQTILMFYVSFGIFTLEKLFLYKDSIRKIELIRVLIPTALSSIALLFYIKFVMDYSVTQNTMDYSLERVNLYLVQFFDFLWQTLSLNSEFYAFSTLPFGLKTILLTIIESLLIGFVFLFLSSKSDWKLPTKRAVITIAALFIYALASLAPCIYGALTGIRPGASWRYLFVPAFPIFGLCILVLVVILQCLPKSWFRMVMIPIVVFVMYLSSLSTYTLNRIWKYQKGIDQKIWSQIDQKILPIHTTIVTINLSEQQAQLFPHYQSQAISDFQADWGVSQRLWPIHRRMIQIGQKVEEIPESNNLKVIGYYADSSWEAPKDSVLFVTYKYGKKFSDLKDAKLNVFATYSEFKKFLDQINLYPKKQL